MSIPDPGFAAQIRECGAVLDMALAQRLYGPLLEQQSTDGVHIQADQVYGPHARHRLDVYRAVDAAGPQPLLLCFHGGGFIRGDKGMRRNLGLYYARRGFTVAVPNYRLGPQDRWPAGAEDVSRSFVWLRQHAADFGGDPARTFIMGESAGAAHIAAATLIRRFHPAGGMPVAGVVLVSGVYNVQLEKLTRVQFGIESPDPRNEPYFGSDFAAYPAMSTVELIDAAPFPLLITYAELDMPQMQVQAGELFARLVTRHGFAPQLRVIAGHNHLTQVFAVNTGDESLAAPVLQFLRDPQALR